MPNWTPSDLIAQQIRQAPKHPLPETQSDGLEGDLHAQIIGELRIRRWFFIRSRMDKRTTTQLGTPDFIIAIPGGKTLWLECKRRNGKLTKEQNITRHVLLASGHWHAVVYNFGDFIKEITPNSIVRESGI